MRTVASLSADAAANSDVRKKLRERSRYEVANNSYAKGIVLTLANDCVGTGQSLTDAMKYVRSRGTVVEVGTSNLSFVDTAPLWLDELTLIGTNGRAIEEYDGKQLHTYQVVFDLIQQGKLDLSGLVTHRFEPKDYAKALAALTQRGSSGAIKAAFVHQ